MPKRLGSLMVGKIGLLFWAALSLAACGERPVAAPAGVPGLEFAASVGQDERAVPDPCPASSVSDFDFWVGSWQLRRPSGELFATDIVTRELDGCVVMEDFINDAGNQARSMSAYDAATDMWYQIYQDNFLGNWRMQGGLRGSEMHLVSRQDVFNFNTQTVQARDATSIWARSSDGTVTQTIAGTLGGLPITFFAATYEPVIDPPRQTPATFPFCRSVIPGFRQLDFWLGDWTVEGPDGGEVGSARARSDLNGCMVQVDFEGRNGVLRRSFLVYDFPTGRWHAYVAENTGDFVMLSGEFEDSALILTGVDDVANGSTVNVRSIIRPAGDGVIETREIRLPNGTWRTESFRRYGP